jgi:hypothetical protein
MDGERFDAAARFLASRGSRRDALAIVAVLAGAGLSGLDSVAAKKKRRRRNKKQRCKDLRASCTSSRQCCGDLACQDVPKACSQSGPYCCSKARGSCGNTCGCCGNLRCSNNNETACCGDAGESCVAHADCCADTGASCNFSTSKCAV